MRDALRTFIWSMHFVYAVTLTLVLCIYTFSQTAFSEGYTTCFVEKNYGGLDIPVRASAVPGSIDMGARMYLAIDLGLWIHLCGIVVDAAMLVRVYNHKNKLFRMTARIAAGSYFSFLIGWISWTTALRFRHIGQVCSGDYLNNPTPRMYYSVK